MARPKLGLALGSGGARGLAHCGVLKALRESGLPIDVIAGTSMGALIGALYAREPDPDRVWERLNTYVEDTEFADYWAAFVPRRDGEDREDARPWSGLFDFMHRGRIAVRTVTTEAAESREQLWNPLVRLFGEETSIEDLALPFAAVALDLVRGDMVVYRRGGLIEALYASCAIPGVFPPMTHDDRVICDGGGPYRTPVDACRALGADVVIAVDIPSFQEPRLRTGFDLGMRSNSVARDRLNAFVCASADAVIRPALEHVHWADFKAAETIRDVGYDAGKAMAPELGRLWRRHCSPVRRFGRWLAGVRPDYHGPGE